MHRIFIYSILFFFFVSRNLSATDHPHLLLTEKGVKEMKASLGKYPAFDKSFEELKSTADKALTEKMEVPIPKDAGGGYTHEKHKNNYYAMNACGILYQLTENSKYAEFVSQMLMKYAKMYPQLGMHPVTKSEVRGKLFWQSLNDAVWLVHTANAYDCVYNYISENDRKYIEKQLFQPMAEFLSNGNENNYATFNKMHNHGTWSLSAVGMIGYVMNDKNLIEKALYGSKKDKKSGFIRQLEVLFSPDGYFTEGPYYQRYSIWPFMTFAQAIQHQQPELNIFKYREGILLKAVNTTLQCAYNGEFFYLNDALCKTFETQEIVSAVDIAYQNNPANKQLLDIARHQNSFIVSDAGLATAKAVSSEKTTSFVPTSVLLHDGANGDEGGIGILRNGKTCLTFKGTSHGLSHGHYDKLSLVLYDNDNCILPDYGAVRFLNIEPKNGGNYTRENNSWALQTIAHNTVTVDEKSNFNGNFKTSSQYHSDINYFDVKNKDVQVISGSDQNAYPGTILHRTTALIKNPAFEYPLVLDIFDVKSDSTHQLDFPFYYNGQMISTNFEYLKNTKSLKTVGAKNGYQHLWLEASGKTEKPTASFTLVNGNRFYSITTQTSSNSALLMTRLGASDPDFNLRNTSGYMIRESNVAKHSFVTVIEPHGLYDLRREITEKPESNISTIELLQNNELVTVVKFGTKNQQEFLFVTVNSDFGEKARSIQFNNKTISFSGNNYFTEIK